MVVDLHPLLAPGGSLVYSGLLTCKDCTLCVQRRRVVPGFGQWPSKVMFVAQSPGYDEDIKGQPLIGKSGQLFTDMLTAIGLPISNYYKTNVVLCHPPADRKTTATENKACRHWLDAQIETVDPDIIVCLGDAAYRAFMPDEPSPITQIRGSVFRRLVGSRERYILPTVHPAFVSRNIITERPKWQADVSKVKDLLAGIAPGSDTIPFRKKPASWGEVLEVVYDKHQRIFGFDLETGSGYGEDHPEPDGRDAKIIGVGVCNTPGDGRYYPFGSDKEASQLMRGIRGAIEDRERLKVVSNVKFEREILQGPDYRIHIVGYHDTMLEAWILGDRPLSLKDGFHHEFGIEMIRIDKFKRMGFTSPDRHGKQQLDMRLAQEQALWDVVTYSSQDPDASLRLHLAWEPLLKRRKVSARYR